MLPSYVQASGLCDSHAARVGAVWTRYWRRAPVQLRGEEDVHSNTLTQIAAGILAGFLALACSAKPEVVTDTGDTDQSGGKSGNNSDGKGGANIQIGDDGGAGSQNGSCKKTCEAGECGPVADGCGDFVECGGCKAPEICGGGGEASRCGVPDTEPPPECEPKTCDDLGASCGLQSDGCGNVLDCWSDAAKASGAEAHCPDPTEQCVEGQCTNTSSCTKLTCKDYDGSDGTCGPVSDGCGGTLECGFECAEEEICGVVEPGRCGSATCEPVTCEEALKGKPSGFCGFIPDGCGGELKNCGATCSGQDTCGGGGTPDVCGHGGTTCKPKVTLADCGSACGPISDGCGGTVDCGGCTAPETCGGGTKLGECGAPACQPKTCAGLKANCGSVPDGCGGTLTCGSCGSAQVCNANVCENVVCKPKTKAEVCTGLCGMQSDGCSGTVDCGGCTGTNTCGGGGTPNVCGSPACTPRTCQDVGANCGPISNGCGGVVQCGSCQAPATCGGGGASKCGVLTDPNCTGLCTNVDTSCSAGSETRLSGTVYAPNGTEPLYNALVYVPNAALPAIKTGPTCERCENEDLGKPIAAALTGADGKFVLKNVPAGVSFPLVVKMGKWRRVVTIPAVTKCTNVNLGVDQTRLPRHMKDASAGNIQYLNIPKTAMVTGKVDEMECVLRKIGVDDSEFTLPSGTGRIHLYRANGAHGARVCTEYRSNGSCRTWSNQNTPLANLFAGQTLDNYDLGVFDCEGSANEHNNDYDAALRSWAERGGRVFASHYSYTYLHDNGNFANTATWGGSQSGNGDETTGILDVGFPKGQAYNQWLGNVSGWHPTYGSGYIHIEDPRGYVKTTSGSSERFVYTSTAARINNTQINQQSAIQQYAFNTPVGASASNICGRVLYTGFHVAGASDNSGSVFPNHCSTGPLTAQEKALEFMLFDLSACVSIGDPPKPPTCTAKTCGAGACGQMADGCGGLLNCGSCTAPNSCGGGGTPNVCGNNCKQTTCGAEGANCGVIADGCGGTLSCGSCQSPAVCGGGGTANVCGVPSCSPRSCSSVGAQCGAIADGCGGTVNCGTCTGSTTCGGGGTPNVCGAGSCNPKTCTSEGANCGFIGDGCGGTVSCGVCANSQVCGAGGPNQCGTACKPRTCGDVGAQCGFIGDGCGGVLDCGTCTAPQICGGGGVPSKCGGACSPRTCAQAGAECGGISDGCGGVLQCGVCPSSQTCGAMTPNKCGAGSCTPKTCTGLGAECGSIGDGCGGILDCGMCVAPQSCGGAGTPNKCGTGTGGCVPRSCAQMDADCGPVADGCGGLLDCGVCPSGQTCGGAGIPSQCGNIH